MKKCVTLIAVMLAMLALHALSYSGVTLLPFDPKSTAEDVLKLIQSGADVNERGKGGITPLMAAAKNCQDPETVEALLRSGAFLFDRDNEGWTALMFALRYNTNVEVALLLIVRGSSVDDEMAGKSLLDYCIENRMDERIVEAIRSVKGLDVTQEGDFTFDRFTGTITSSREPIKDLVVPQNIGGFAVRSIGREAFAYDDTLETIIIPEGVVAVGRGAFMESINLFSADIPESVASIGEDSFYMCLGLTLVTIRNEDVKIGDDAFSGCPNLTIFGYKGSTAQEYAMEEGIRFGVIGEYQPFVEPDGFNGLKWGTSVNDLTCWPELVDNEIWMPDGFQLFRIEGDEDSSFLGHVWKTMYAFVYGKFQGVLLGTVDEEGSGSSGEVAREISERKSSALELIGYPDEADENGYGTLRIWKMERIGIVERTEEGEAMILFVGTKEFIYPIMQLIKEDF